MTDPAQAPPRLGVVGVGSLGYHHARIARDLSGPGFAGFYETRKARADEVARTLEIEAQPSLDALLAQTDAVVVATPTRTHADVALEAISRGVHVFIEKPIASTLDEADRILEAADRNGVVVQVGHVERFNGAILAAQPYLDEPLFVESHRLSPFTERGTDVAVVLDLMIHDVDLVGSLVGRPIREFRATGVPVLTPAVDIANARLEFEGGAVANLTASRVSAERMRKLRIFQRSGYLSLDLAAGTGEFLRLKADLLALAPGSDLQAALGEGASRDLWTLVERIPIRSDGVEPLRREQESFLEAVRGRHPPAVSGREGRDALEVALSIESRIMSHVADSRSAEA